jgi:hypothetical protein
VLLRRPLDVVADPAIRLGDAPNVTMMESDGLTAILGVDHTPGSKRVEL